MKNFLLLITFIISGLFSYPQQAAVNRNTNWQQSMLEEKGNMAPQQNQSNSGSKNKAGRISSRSVSLSVKLNSQRIGSSGNLLSVDNANCKQIDVNDSLNTVVFIHRNDPTAPGGYGNIAQYQFDASTDGGNTWKTNIGPITNSPQIDNVTVNGRFPQACIYNPAGNTAPDNALLVYSGTWHDDPGNNTGNWEGQMRGKGKLSGDTSTFNVHIDQINNGHVGIASGFCQSKPGVFWNLNEAFNGTFAANSHQITTGLLIEKGTWNPVANDVQWTLQSIPQAFDSALDGSIYVSEVTSFNIAFDPSGQYGWIGCLGAIGAGDSCLRPIFWQSVDSGNTWNGPIVVRLDSMPEVIVQLNGFNTLGTRTSKVPTTAFDENMVVDYLGHPHMAVIVGNAGGGFAITKEAGYSAWDITYNPNLPVCETGWKGWYPLFLDSVETLRGTFSSDQTPITQDNRPLAARSGDGKKVFFYWVDSDISYEGSDNNSDPNLFTRAYDLVHFSSTNAINLTLGDSIWGGATSTTLGGIIGGATFGTCAPISYLEGSSTDNIPFVLTQIDYNHDPSQGLGSYENPAAYWYINNISYDPYDFVNGLAASVSMNGPDSIVLLHGTPYTEYGGQIGYLDTACYHVNPLHLVIDSSSLNTNVDGSYFVHYYAEDDNGNIYGSASRQITIGSPPVAGFTFGHITYNYKVQFRDASLFSPTTWHWDFGDNTSAQGTNAGFPLHIYHQDGVYTVCMTAYNSFGSSDICRTVSVTDVGIKDVTFSANIALYPNPTSGKVNLSVSENTLSELSISVLDMLGKEVVATSKYPVGTSKIEMDLTSLASGTYLVKVTCDEGTAVKYLNITDNR